VLKDSLQEILTSNVNKTMKNTMFEINKSIEQVTSVSEQRVKEINKIAEDYKKEFEEYKEKTERKTTYWERRNNIRDGLFYISVFAMPIYVIIEICLKFLVK
jgi:transketolase